MNETVDFLGMAWYSAVMDEAHDAAKGVRVNVVLPADLYDLLRREADREDRTLSQVVRRRLLKAIEPGELPGRDLGAALLRHRKPE